VHYGLEGNSVVLHVITRHGIAARYDSVIGRNALVCCKFWFDWSLTDFIHGTLSQSNTYFRQHFLNSITDVQRQSELFVNELLDLREHSSILKNGITLLRSEIDSLIASVCCT